MACVEDEENTQEIEELVEEIINTTGVPLNEQEKETDITNTELEEIRLHPQVIKSEDTLKGTSNKENLDNEKILGKANYPAYGFVIFCFLLGFLFIIKKNRFNKNEFR